MSAVVGLVMLLFVAFWGSVYLATSLKRSGELRSPQQDALLARVQEELEEVQQRLASVEEQLSFDRELRSPERPPSLPPPEPPEGA